MPSVNVIASAVTRLPPQDGQTPEGAVPACVSDAGEAVGTTFRWAGMVAMVSPVGDGT